MARTQTGMLNRAHEQPSPAVSVDEYMFDGNDNKILDCILGKVPYEVYPKNVIDKNLKPDQYTSAHITKGLMTLETQAIILESQSKYRESLDIYNHIIDVAPLYASAYSNRAQLVRTIDKSHDPYNGVIPDLKRAIDLAKPKCISASMSKMQVDVICNAYKQLSDVYLQLSKIPENWEKARSLRMKSSEMMIEASIYNEQILGISNDAEENPYAI